MKISDDIHHGCTVCSPPPWRWRCLTSAAQPANQKPSRTQAAPAAAKKVPQAKTKAEFDAYQSAAAQTDPAKLEAAATDFAQKFPDSELRPFLFQQAMGLYQQANNTDKTLEMARAVLKYDPNQPGGPADRGPDAGRAHS